MPLDNVCLGAYLCRMGASPIKQEEIMQTVPGTTSTSVIVETAGGYARAGTTFSTYREALRDGLPGRAPWSFTGLDGTSGRILADGSIRMASGAHRDKYAVPMGPDGSYTCEFCAGRGETNVPQGWVEGRPTFKWDTCDHCHGAGRCGGS